MKCKYLLPFRWESWEIDREYGHYVMRLIDRRGYFTVWHTMHNQWMHSWGGTFDTPEEAQKDLMNQAIGHGYIVLTDEQAQRLEVLI